jgi:hypothetical protein
MELIYVNELMLIEHDSQKVVIHEEMDSSMDKVHEVDVIIKTPEGKYKFPVRASHDLLLESTKEEFFNECVLIATRAYYAKTRE